MDAEWKWVTLALILLLLGPAMFAVAFWQDSALVALLVWLTRAWFAIVGAALFAAAWMLLHILFIAK